MRERKMVGEKQVKGRLLFKPFLKLGLCHDEAMNLKGHGGGGGGGGVWLSSLQRNRR